MKIKILLVFLVAVSFASKSQTPYFPNLNLETMQWNYVDISGKNVLNISLKGIQDLRPFSNGLSAALDSTSAKWGFINTKGKWAIQPTFESVEDFVDEYAIVSFECSSNCNQNHEGLLSTFISQIIDKKGKVIFTDKSQHDNPSERFFLDENIGAGLFRVTMGYGFNDMKNVIDLKGNFLCETYSVFGNGGNIIFEKDLNAYKCFNRYYKPDGKLVLDLSEKYYFVYAFSEGYAWANVEEQLGEEEFILWNVLVDLKGKEILKLNNAEYNFPEAVENGGFVYLNQNGEQFKYILAEKKSVPHQPSEIESEPGIELGEKQANGCRFLFSTEDNVEAIGFVNPAGNVFYKISL